MTVNDLGTDTTLHRQTFQVTSPNAQIYAIFIEAGGTYPNFTEGFYASGTTFVCQQVLDVNSIWRTPYSFSPRNKDPIAFTDVGGNVFAFDLTSKEHTNTQGTAPIFPPAPAIGFNQNPITFPFVPPGFGLGVSFPGWEAENVTAAEQPVSRPLPLAHEAKYYDPVLFSGIDVEIPFLTDTFDGASITVLATLQTLEARLTQTDVFGVALLDRLETSMIVRTIEGCPTALPRFPDDTPAIPTFENMEVCCHE